MAAAAPLFRSPGAGGSSQLAPSHGHSLAGLQVTPKAALCKQEISGSHSDSSEMRLGPDDGASRLHIPPHLPSLSPSFLFKSQRDTPKTQRRHNGSATVSGLLGKIPQR